MSLAWLKVALADGIGFCLLVYVAFEWYLKFSSIPLIVLIKPRKQLLTARGTTDKIAFTEWKWQCCC